jgi:hypothetical protein
MVVVEVEVVVRLSEERKGMAAVATTSVHPSMPVISRSCSFQTR